MRPIALAFCATLALAAACGPSLTQLRRYMAGSPHRRVAIFPFDVARGSAIDGPSAASLFQNKLGPVGFSIVDRAKTLDLYRHSLLVEGSFNALADASGVAKLLGAQAALVGRVDSAREIVTRQPAIYAYDDEAHRRRLRTAAQTSRTARFSVRLRLVDAGSGRVLWESSYGSEMPGTLANIQDGVASVLVDQLTNAYLQQGL